MNDLSKTIEVDKSSLISLKAELLRKKDEAVNSKKQSIFAPKKIPKLKLEPPPAQEQQISKKKDEDPEENYMLKRSREILERKSKFYEHMMKSNVQNDNYLVMFDKKNREKESPESSESDSEIGPTFPAPQTSDDIEIGPPIPASLSSSDSREVEYIDCLGRTRKILEKDLLKVKAQDKDLYESAENRTEQFKDNKIFR